MLTGKQKIFRRGQLGGYEHQTMSLKKKADRLEKTPCCVERLSKAGLCSDRKLRPKLVGTLRKQGVNERTLLKILLLFWKLEAEKHKPYHTK